MFSVSRGTRSQAEPWDFLLSIVTAIKEANQVGALQPTTLVSYEGDIENVFDTRDVEALAAYEMDAAVLADPSWRDRMIAEALMKAGFHGLLAQSFVHGAAENDLNLVLWTWGSSARASLVLIDDEKRLGGERL